MSGMQPAEIAGKVLVDGKMRRLMRGNSDPSGATSNIEDFLRSHDWSQTPLGSVESWPQSLKTALNILFDACCPMLLIWGDDRILFYNNAYSSVLSECNAQIPLAQPINGTKNEFWSSVRSDVEQVFKTPQSLQRENQLFPHHQDGDRNAVAYTWCYSPLWDEVGQVGGVLATGYRAIWQESTTAAGVRQYQEIETTLGKREEQLRLITNALPVLIAYVDKDHYYRFNSQTYETWFGQPVATFTDRHVREVLGESAYAAVLPYMEQALSGELVSYESQIPYQEGGTRYIRADYIPHINNRGEVEGYCSLVSDITDRKQAEEALRRSEQEFRAVFDLTSVGMAQADPQTRRLLRVNAAFCTLTGYSEGELLAMRVDDLNHPEERERERELFINLLEGKTTTYQAEKRYLRKDGSTVWVFATGNVIRDAPGQALRIVAILQDITERKQTEEELRKSEERFRLVTQAVNGLIFDWNLLTNEAYRSEKLYELVGVRAQDAPPNATWWHERIHPDDFARLRWQVGELLTSSSHLYDVEYRIRHEDGHWVDVWEQSFLIKDEHGKTIRIVGCTVDISDRKQIEEALRTSEERLRFAVEGAALGTWEYNLASSQIFWSERAKLMFGAPLDALVDYKMFINAIHPDDRDRIHTAVERAIAEQELYDVEMRSVWADGSIHWIRSIGRARYDQYGVATSTIGVALDITERKQAEEDLRESERRFRRLVESNMFGVAFGDFTGGIYYANDYFLNMVGYTRAELEAGQLRWADITPAEFLPLDEKAISELKTRGVATPFEKEYIRKDGSRVPISIGSALLQEPYDRQSEIIAFYIDLTEQKQAEAERERLLHQAQVAREEAETANRIKDEFLAVLSHELRSPLNPILGWSKLLQTRQFDRQGTQRALQTIERNAKLQTQLIEDLLDVSRILQGKMSLNINPVNLVAVVESALETVQLAANAKKIEIQTIFTANQVQIFGDSARLQQIVWNLLSNAVKFTPEGGLVEVCLNRIDSYAQIQVKDTGKGINPDFLPYVFDCFRQEDGKTTRKFGGLGLGLAIVRHLSEQHGGTVRAESPGEGRGATFTVRLPSIVQVKHLPENNSTIAQSTDLSQLRILVVDDDEDMRNLAQVILEQQQMQVTVAASAAEALLMFDRQVPDILISDIGMPEMDGYMLMQQIRHRSPEQGGLVSAIALTAYAGEYDRKQALKAGFQKHISKPVEPGELIKAIVDLLTSSPS